MIKFHVFKFGLHQLHLKITLPFPIYVIIDFYAETKEGTLSTFICDRTDLISVESFNLPHRLNLCVETVFFLFYKNLMQSFPLHKIL